nr:MAG TPA: Major capsid protein [Microviridae sp.]
MPSLEAEVNKYSLPKLSYRRSRHYYEKNYKTTLNTGMLIPIYANELTQPGDTFKIDLSFIAREVTPLQPVMDNLYIQFFGFAVDWLDIWNDTKAFWGENTQGVWAQETEYFTPQIKIPANTKITAHSLLAYFGWPQKKFAKEFTTGGGLSVNAYCLTYNEWFRNQNYIPPLEINMAGTTITYNPTDVTKGGLVKNSMKFHDRFTSGVPAPERGEPVPVPFGTEAPVRGYDNKGMLFQKYSDHNITAGIMSSNDNSGAVGQYYRPDPQSAIGPNFLVNLVSAESGKDSGVYADLADAVSAALSAQRLAIATNHILEKLAMYGGRYREIIKACWGVESSDLSQHIPEYLGGWRQPLNMDEVVATTAAENQELGNTGAMSLTNGFGNIMTKSFNQHAVILILCTIRHNQTYGQGLPRQYFKSRKYDYYWNEYAGVSFQPVFNGELVLQGTAEDKEAFSFLPPWSEYKSEENQLTGMFNPYYSTNDGNTENWLKEWTYGNKFANLPMMGEEFLEQGPENVDRTITVQSTLGDQFLLDCQFLITKWSEVPDFRVVGLDRF